MWESAWSSVISCWKFQFINHFCQDNIFSQLPPSIVMSQTLPCYVHLVWKMLWHSQSSSSVIVVLRIRQITSDSPSPTSTISSSCSNSLVESCLYTSFSSTKEMIFGLGHSEATYTKPWRGWDFEFVPVLEFLSVGNTCETNFQRNAWAISVPTWESHHYTGRHTCSWSVYAICFGLLGKTIQILWILFNYTC